MNTKRDSRLASPHSRLVVRLWGIMMVMALLSIAFMWVAQIFLVERNYTESAIADVQNRLEPIMEDLKTEDLAYNDKLVPYLSKSTNGKMILIDEGGELIALYSYGHPIALEIAEMESLVWINIKRSKEYQNVLQGEQYKKVVRDGSRITSFEIGIPVMYDGQKAYVVLHHSLDEVHAVLQITRRQLVRLSVLLTISAALLAALLSRQFTKPIHIIKGTVDRLAKGDLEASPGLTQKDELGQLSQSVEELGEALRRVDVLRKEVIANVSHELRSPLSLIIGYGEMVRDISWKDDGERVENMNLIISEAKRMSEMVSDIMDYSQFQAGYIQLKKDCYNLYEIVESETALCRQTAAEHGIRIGFPNESRELPVYVDALKITQVMRNLLYNAINHTKDNEEILVRIDREGDSFRVSVANPGKPIPEEERASIWERYYRSPHRGGRRQGTGIGLSIVSTILDAHGICYGVEYEGGHNVFWFSCPGCGDGQGGS